MALEWEVIERSKYSKTVTERTKVPGGWLVRWYNYDHDMQIGGGGELGGYGYGYGGMTFVPDPRHEWDGNSLP